MQQNAWIPNFLFNNEICFICVKVSKEQTNALRFMNVILFHNNHRQVSATHVAVFRVMSTRIQKQI